MTKYNYMSGSDINYMDDLYSKYKSDPLSVDLTWQKFFEGFDYSITNSLGSVKFTESSVAKLIEGYRRYAHLKSLTNPVRTRRDHDVHLDIDKFDLKDSDLIQKFSVGKEINLENKTLKEIIEKLNKIYLGPIGFEYVNIRNIEEVQWIKNWVEEKWYNQSLNIEKKKSILTKLNEAVVFENFLHTKYIGQKRFSLEGGENTITFLNEIVKSACKDDVKEVVIGMAHRGRLNVLTSILQKTYDEVFNEFEGNMEPDKIFGDGDVKYHLGYSSYINEGKKSIYVKLIPNPSHLESVNPVVMGYTRAQIDEEYNGNFNSAIPILIHGDAAIAGQGIVYETIQMSKLKGYSVGGVIHFIINNQIGFTTDYDDARSSIYCTDLAKIIDSPVLHINGDDPEAVYFASQFALEYRQKFNKDVFIDLLCYRRHGHNESDEPKFTQPNLYDLISKHPSPRDVYFKNIIDVEDKVDKGLADKLNKEFKALLQERLNEVKQKPLPYKPQKKDEEWNFLRSSNSNDFISSPDTSI
ncbi:MAG: thiamine pyrophosphate-dependent enzyme, partial [Bacteroidota bacterium]|nr:thiamine pyrophosphate-dependent enzyme [Bacteroidota bacterium]